MIFEFFNSFQRERDPPSYPVVSTFVGGGGIQQIFNQRFKNSREWGVLSFAVFLFFGEAYSFVACLSRMQSYFFPSNMKAVYQNDR